MTRPSTPVMTLVAALAAGSFVLDAQVTSDRLLNAAKEPHNWITYNGDYASQRHSTLTQITPENVDQLVPRWTFQTGTLGNFETTSLLRDNVLYVTGPQNVAWAIDVLWHDSR